MDQIKEHVQKMKKYQVKILQFQILLSKLIVSWHMWIKQTGKIKFETNFNNFEFTKYLVNFSCLLPNVHKQELNSYFMCICASEQHKKKSQIQHYSLFDSVMVMSLARGTVNHT